MDPAINLLRNDSVPPGDVPAHHRIEAVELTGGYVCGVRMAFADGLHCIIGGRGSGKTTVLAPGRVAPDEVDPHGRAQPPAYLRGTDDESTRRLVCCRPCSRVFGIGGAIAHGR